MVINMGFFKKLSAIITALLALFFLLIIICAVNPDLSKRIGNFLFPEKDQTISLSSNHTDLTVPIVDGVSENDIAKEPVQTPLFPDYNANQSVIPNGNNQPASNQTLDWGSTGIAKDTASTYVAPNTSGLIIPDTVSGKNGYQPLQEEYISVSDTQAEQIQDQLGTGFTGEGLTFDSYWYPYYGMLDERGQHIYCQIYANAKELNAAFVPLEPITSGQLKNALMAVYNDHPELFWLDTAYTCKYTADGRCAEIGLQFNRTAQNLESSISTFENRAREILDKARGLSSDYAKEVYVHDALIGSITYNLRAEMNQSAYSALVNGQTVCAGYARAFQYLMQQLNIPCYYCAGYAGERHAWNIIVLDDGCYNVDTTWDDVGDGNYDYFNKNDADYASNHVRQELSVYLPPCNGRAYRNLEKPPQTASSNQTTSSNQAGPLRTLTDVGISESQVIKDMAGYYQNCHNQILANGKGEYTFYNVIEGRQLLTRWEQEIDNGTYEDEYMTAVMVELGAGDCQMQIHVEELQGDRYLITHKITIK
ncbi:MAG: hypothetical protein K2K96_13805 [Lachnospiraceae bacterium]|nr:hypothetical protein [Lachnospiraceae bacterium]